MTALILIFSLLAHIVIGGRLGQFSWCVWHREVPPGLSGFLLFPFSFREGSFGRSDTGEGPYWIGKAGDKNAYIAAVAFLAWLKVAWCAFAIAVCFAEATLRLLIFGPKSAASVFRYESQKKPESTQETEATPVEPEGSTEAQELPEDARLVLEHRRLLEERVVREARISAIESVPGFEKMHAMHSSRH